MTVKITIPMVAGYRQEDDDVAVLTVDGNQRPVLTWRGVAYAPDDPLHEAPYVGQVARDVVSEWFTGGSAEATEEEMGLARRYLGRLGGP